MTETPSQTAGPYVHIGLLPEHAGLSGVAEFGDRPLYGPDARGERIVLTGRVLDGLGAPVSDAVVELWQTDPDGRVVPDAMPRPLEGFEVSGWGRTACDGEGRFTFHTLKPGRSALGTWGHLQDRLQAPHVALWIVARGINIGLHTRVYFGDEVEANRADPLLSTIMPLERRSTLVAARDGNTFRHDIHLQGPHETVFLDV